MPWLARKSFWLVLIASLALNAGVGATFGVRAYENYREPCEARGPRTHGRLTEMLNLTPEQADRMMTARRELMESMADVRSDLREAHEGLTGLMATDQPDREAVAKQIDRIALLRGRLQHRLVGHFMDAREQLRPDQREALDTLMRRQMFPSSGHGRAGMNGQHRSWRPEGR